MTEKETIQSIKAMDNTLLSQILAIGNHLKNTVYICTENDEIFTLATLGKMWIECKNEGETFAEFMSAATDMSGSLREIVSIRHYLYMINFYVESAEKDYFVPFQEAVIYHQI